MSITLPDVDPSKITGLSQAKDAITTLLNTIEELVRQNNQLVNEVQSLKKEMAKHKKQPPPPSFGNRANSSYSVSKRFQCKQRKNWHKSSKKDQIEIDQECKLPEVNICRCGSKAFKTIRTRQKIVQGVILKRNNTRYQGRDKQCVGCGKIYKAQIPKEIKGVEFDSQLRSRISFFKFKCRYTEPLIYDFLTSLGIKISVGQISNIILKNSHKLTPAYTHLRVWGVKASRYLHSDATGAKIKMRKTGRIVNQYLHVISNKLLSLYKITRRYNSETMGQKVLGKRAMSKIFISDDAGANGKKLSIKKKQLSWFHEIRHYLKLAPAVKLHQKKLEDVIDEWWRFYLLARQYGRDPTRGGRRQLEQGFAEIVRQKTGYQELNHRLQLTRRKRERLLLFLEHPEIPIDNNQAERDLREAVIMRKISGGTKSREGDRSIERHLSIIQTAEKQGLDVFQTLHGLLTGQLSPFVLTAKRPA